MATPYAQASEQDSAARRAKVFKALADPCRVRIVELLAETVRGLVE